MKYTFVLAILILLSGLTFTSPSGISNRLQDTISDPDLISLKYGSREVFCYVACPENSTNSSGVIVIHEEWGLTDWIKSFSDEIASMGHIVIAPDLLSGLKQGKNNTKDFMNEDLARRSLLKVDPDQIVSDLDAAFHFLKEHPLCNGKVVVIGFSWGGSQILNYMVNNPEVSAGFIFYGKSSESKKELGRIAAPVYGFYGEYDSRINPSVWKTDRKMKSLGKTFEPTIFEGGGHGFMRSGERPGANEGNIKARSAAWRKLNELLSGI